MLHWPTGKKVQQKVCCDSDTAPLCPLYPLGGTGIKAGSVMRKSRVHCWTLSSVVTGQRRPREEGGREKKKIYIQKKRNNETKAAMRGDVLLFPVAKSAAIIKGVRFGGGG